MCVVATRQSVESGRDPDTHPASCSTRTPGGYPCLYPTGTGSLSLAVPALLVSPQSWLRSPCITKWCLDELSLTGAVPSTLLPPAFAASPSLGRFGGSPCLLAWAALLPLPFLSFCWIFFSRPRVFSAASGVALAAAAHSRFRTRISASCPCAVALVWRHVAAQHSGRGGREFASALRLLLQERTWSARRPNTATIEVIRMAFSARTIT